MKNINSRLASDRRFSANFICIIACLATLGGIALIVGNVVGSIVVPDHNWISDTVSDLAAGRYEIIQDVALYGYAGALAALALGCAHLHGGDWRWGVLTTALALLAVCVIIIGARNEYGDSDNEGIVIHVYIVYLMGALFIASFILAARIFANAFEWFATVSWWCVGIWALGAPIFFVMPTGYDGAWERGLGVVAVVWTSALAKVMWTTSTRK